MSARKAVCLILLTISEQETTSHKPCKTKAWTYRVSKSKKRFQESQLIVYEQLNM